MTNLYAKENKDEHVIIKNKKVYCRNNLAKKGKYVVTCGGHVAVGWQKRMKKLLNLHRKQVAGFLHTNVSPFFPYQLERRSDSFALSFSPKNKQTNKQKSRERWNRESRKRIQTKPKN